MDIERINDERRKQGRPPLTRAQAEHARITRPGNSGDFMNYMIMYAVIEAGHSDGTHAHVDHAHDAGSSPMSSSTDTGSTDTGSGGSDTGSSAP